jgi:hypothetical protein
MTQDQAIAIKVRIATAMRALDAALKEVAGCDPVIDAVLVESDLRQARRLASNSVGICDAVIARRTTTAGSPIGYRSDTRVSSEQNDDR